MVLIFGGFLSLGPVLIFGGGLLKMDAGVDGVQGGHGKANLLLGTVPALQKRPLVWSGSLHCIAMLAFMLQPSQRQSNPK